MKYLLTLLLVLLLGWRVLAWGVHLASFHEPVQVYDCQDRGYPVIVNNEWVACTSDSASFRNVYIPSKGIPEMVPIREYDDSWMDGKD